MQIASHTNPKNIPLDSHGKRGWSNSLFGCFSDCGTCRFSRASFGSNGRTSPSILGLTAVFCPCIAHSLVHTRFDHLSKHGSPHPSGGDACGSACFLYAITSCIGVSCILQVRLFVVTDFGRRGTQALYSALNEATLVIDTTSLVTLAPTASSPAAAMFAASSKSPVRSSLRRTLMGNRPIKFSYPLPRDLDTVLFPIVPGPPSHG